MKRIFRIMLVVLLVVGLISGNRMNNSTVVMASNPTENIDDYKRALEEARKEAEDLREKLDNLETEKPKTHPKIKLQDPTVISVTGARTQDFEITIKNVGSGYASNTLTQAKLGAEAPFSITFLDKSNATGSIYSNGSKKIKMQIVVDKNAASGLYPITLEHSYLNDSNEVLSDTDTLTIKIQNDAANLNVVMYNFSNDHPVVSPGDEFTLSATIENVSAQKANDVQVQVEGLKSTEVFLANSVSSTYFKDMNANSTNSISFKLASSSKIKSGTYPLSFKITYRDLAGKTYENTYYYYVNIGGTVASENNADITVGNMQSPTAEMAVGQEFTIKFPVTNNGLENAKNVKIVATTDTDGAIVPKSANIQMINNLAAGETKELQFKFTPTSKAKSQNYSIGFAISYETGKLNDDNSNEVMTFSQYASVNVNNPKAEEGDLKGTPKIIISRYASDPTIVKAGSEFELTIAFQNTNKEKTIENVKATLTAVAETEKKGNVFTPVNSSNTFYIDSIAPKAEVEKKLTLYTVPDAAPKNYIITVNFEYEDSDHKEYKYTDQIGINVKQVTKLDIGDINVQPESFIGQPASVYFDFYNTGKVTLSNLMIKLEGNFDTTNSSSYYSNFSPGNQDSYEGNFVPTEAGEQKGKILITYEDDAGEKIEQVKEFTVNVMETPPMEEFDPSMREKMENEMKPPTLIGRILGFFVNPWLIGGIVVGVAVIGVVVFIFIRRAIKKRKSQDLDI